MSKIETAASQMDEPKGSEPEDVHVDKNIDAKETRICHMCTLCHTQLHKICSTDPKMAIISVAKEGAPKGWGNQGHGATGKATDSAKSKVDDNHSKDTKSSLDSSEKTGMDSSAKTSSHDSKEKKNTTGEGAKSTSWTSPAAGPSGGSSFGDSSNEFGKDAKNWKKKLEEEEERKKKKKWEEEERKRQQQAKGSESTVKPSHEEWEKKKKKEY